MADEDSEPKYQLKVKEDGDIRDTSKHFDGAAVATYLNGDVYDGTFLAGRRDGTGSYTFANNGDKYVGGYLENKRSGMGKFCYSEKPAEEPEDPENAPVRGGEYHGEWAENKREGGGTFKYVNGDTYSGAWKHGKKHGKGVYRYSSDGSTLSGKWADGMFVQGTWTLANGVKYVGSFKWNQPIGDGVWVFPGGNQLCGSFTQVEERDEDETADEETPAEAKPPNAVAVSWKSGVSVRVN
mmetsp:Transcript_18393/g.45946  ORF Transcript_18393/g.45946 Transcript_18393/m.45946 type:complete len:239 (-) Transcript_18393:429-1145(-)|eukprot:CAMPEP_0178994994 /NCGR_PEP_ID=MMETSP0795-20121207/7596_1 /TAXON_ID=88552 /ORGANISM="Amoebophrya sp., Strain Ameob2" /LENGTH=238 /DNA_ID=CAMNT_0020687283 /DNA_START=98 /DNA_END=814 /DNA_ORIENTATION=+